MKLTYPKLLKENIQYIVENLKQAKQYLDAGKISKDDLKQLVDTDPTENKKYVGWMAKIWINEQPDLDDLRNAVEEYNTFANKGKIKTKDINAFKSFKDLQAEIDDINQSAEGVSVKDLESDYETVVDNDDLLIMCPHTHEASRKLGLSYFAFRDCKGGGKDSAWCTTYKAPDHFNDYYYARNVTFYYVKVKSEKLLKELKDAFPKRWKLLQVVALAILDKGRMDGYDAADKQISSADIKKYTNTIGIS